MLAFALNIPTPVVVQKDIGIAFPCQDRPCGCENAQQCWGSCCCFSDAEKLCWAKAHQVIPPDWFLEKIADEQLIASLRKKSETECVSAVPKKSSCCCCRRGKTSSGADSSAMAGGKQALTKKKKKKTIAVRTTIQQLLGCQGKQELEKKQVVCVVDTTRVTFAFPYRQSLPVISESGSSLGIAPPTPPS